LNKTPPKKKMTHVVREKKRKNLNDILKFVVFSIIAVVVGLVGVGVGKWYQDDYKPMHETVIEVNGTKFDMQYYIEMLRYISGEYIQFAQYFTDTALQYIEYYELLKQGAADLGITVSDKEVNAEIKKNKYNNTPAAKDMVRAGLLIPLLEDHFGAQINPSAEQSNLLAMFLESQAQVEAVKARLAGGESFEDIAKELSLDSATQKADGVLSWLPKGVIANILGASALTDELIFGAAIGELNTVEDTNKNKPVGYWILQVTERSTKTDEDSAEETEVAKVKAILLGSKEKADEVLSLLNNGGDFDALAEEYSLIWSEESGCVLEVEKEDNTAAFDGFVFNSETELNVISEVIQDVERNTKGGYWIYKVTEKAVRDISETNMKMLIGNALEDWIDGFDEDSAVLAENIEDMKKFAAANILR